MKRKGQGHDADKSGQIDLFGGCEQETVTELENKRNVRELKPLSKVARRAIKTSVEIEMETPEDIAYQHTVLCQTSLPYRDQGAGIRRWKREQGFAVLEVEAGRAFHPAKNEFIDLSLPFGTKPRLILAHLNAQALKTASPVLDMDESLTAFVKRVQGRDPTGPNIRAFKDHLGRLAASTIRMAVAVEGHAIQVDSKIVTAFDLWFPKNEQQRILWPSTIHLSLDYFNSLQNHAIPLDERALGALAHSSMALDIYSWLAQRLHRIPRTKPQFIAWAAVKSQFGQGYGKMNNFKRVFRVAMKQVLVQYQAANVEEDGRGLTLRNSAPPVSKKLYLVNKPVNG